MSSTTNATTERQKLRQRIAEGQQDLANCQAKMRQQQEQSRRDLAERQKYAGLELMRDLMPIADNLERLLISGRQSGDADAMIEGVEIIRNQLYDLLENHGLRELPGAYNAFNPKQHEVVGNREDQEHPNGSVLEVVRQGYRLHDKVVRPSQVIVSKDNE